MPHADPSKAEVGLKAGGARAFAITLGVGAACIGAAVLLRAYPVAQARVAMIGIGLVALTMASLRPRGFWHAGSIQLWREVVGERAVVALMGLLGAFFILFGLLVPVS